ncbi:AraC family transcriptional regulator [Paenibacillus sonchi]|uniref:AraC family transcriptional regulator n=1 Tax=Paenibacillus sonchi TaxID=373687 RepID=A0A974SC87_9BACL|nr:AraC family transcriptional regulator [Paenibacillus sonchi]QQZ61183.1 AraC family transcriptional regulator [Paenibacillus sonchi]
MVVTDEQMKEMATHGSRQFPIEYYVDDTAQFSNHCINRHWHDEVEFAFIQEGHADYWIGEKSVPLSEGDGIFINTRIIHGYKASRRAIVPNIVFSPELVSGGNQTVYQKFVQPLLYSSISCLYLSSRIHWQEEIIRNLQTVFHLLNSGEETKEIDVQIGIASIWRSLYLHRHSCMELPQTPSFLNTQARLRMMLEYIYENYREKLRLLDIASAAKVSKSEALRCFKEGTDTSPVDYLIQFRLNKARELMLTTGNTVSEVAEMTGFETVGYFDRMFKKAFGVTPKHLRMR